MTRHPDSDGNSAGTLGMVLKGYPRISETFISNEIRLLERMGFRIHIFSMRAPRENFTHDSIREIRARVTYLPETMIKGLPALLRQTFRFALRHPRRFGKGLALMRTRFALAPKVHTWVKHILQGAYLAQTVEDEHIDLAHLHAHFAHTPTTVAMYAAIFTDVPFSFTAHAKDIYTQDPRRILDKLDMARFVVTCTKYNELHLRTICHNARPVHCVYHGINLDLFSPNGKSVQAMPPYDILTVARFVPKKGLDTVLRALKHLRDQGMDFRYTLVGEGTEQPRITALIHDLGLEDVVSLPGTITHDQVIRLLHTADCFALGCREAEDGDRDGIPNVVAEAMAVGVPVAATTVSGLPEMVEHESTGLLCAPNDPAALAANIRRILEDAPLRARLIPAGIDKVRAVFDNKQLIRELGEIYAAHGVPRQRN